MSANDIGKVLRSARRRRGKSLRETAVAAGVSNAYLCQLEGGKNRILSIGWLTLSKVAAAYGIEREELEARMYAAAHREGLIQLVPREKK